MPTTELPAPPADPVAYWKVLPDHLKDCLAVLARYRNQKPVRILTPASLATSFFNENFELATGSKSLCGFQQRDPDRYSCFILPDDPELTALFVSLFVEPETPPERLKHYLRYQPQYWLICLHHYFRHGAYAELNPYSWTAGPR